MRLLTLFPTFALSAFGAAIVTGEYAPTTNNAIPTTFSAPAPATPTTSALSTFTGTNANGTWSLYVQDFVPSDFGSIAGGWSISFFPPPPAAVAQSSAFIYQGKLESNSAAVDGSAAFRFSLWGSAASTTPTGQIGSKIARNAVPVSKGLFTVSLDFGFGVVDNKDLFLQIETRSPAGSGAFTTLAPRQLLTAALNAQFARNAANAASAANATNVTNAANADNASALNSTGRIIIGGTASPNDGTSPGLVPRSPAITGTDRALIGMRSDNLVGLFGPTAGWDLLMDTTTGFVGVGLTGATPTVPLDVNGSALIRTSSTASTNVLAFGTFGTGAGNTAENSDPMAIFRTNPSNDVSKLRILIGDNTAPGVVDSLVIGVTPNRIWTPLFTFTSDGNAFKPDGGFWAAFSDPRAKHDIAPLTGTLDRILRLKGYSYLYNDDVIAKGSALPGTQIGLMADEVAKVFPDWVSTDATGTRYVTKRATTALMVEALRDLRAEKDKQLAAVRAENAKLRERLDRLEKLLIGRPDGQ